MECHTKKKGMCDRKYSGDIALATKGKWATGRPRYTYCNGFICSGMGRTKSVKKKWEKYVCTQYSFNNFDIKLDFTLSRT